MIKELDYIERLRLALEYSISEEHKKSLIARIEQYTGNQLSFNEKIDKSSPVMRII